MFFFWLLLHFFIYFFSLSTLKEMCVWGLLSCAEPLVSSKTCHLDTEASENLINLGTAGLEEKFFAIHVTHIKQAKTALLPLIV